MKSSVDLISSQTSCVRQISGAACRTLGWYAVIPSVEVRVGSAIADGGGHLAGSEMAKEGVLLSPGRAKEVQCAEHQERRIDTQPLRAVACR